MKKTKKISPEDQEVLKALDLIHEVIGGVMASIADAQAKLESLKIQNGDLIAKIAALETEMTNAFNRLEAKIAAGVDVQPLIDGIDAISQSQTNAATGLDSSIAQAQVEGV